MLAVLVRAMANQQPACCSTAQDRLISLVAGYLLDCNSEERLIQAGASAEYQANLHRNIADSIALLPKLTTGVDVNVKFHDFRAFEFTDEIAVFDLLDMSLVHGWLVDPQVACTSCSTAYTLPCHLLAACWQPSFSAAHQHNSDLLQSAYKKLNRGELKDAMPGTGHKHCLHSWRQDL